MIKIKPAQSILEYAILIAIVIAAVVVMQVYMKRGISGRLKESSDKISGGEAFSASNTATWQRSVQSGDRNITEMTATNDKASTLATDAGYTDTVVDINSTAHAYSAGKMEGGVTDSNSMSRTDSAANEAFKAGDLTSSSVGGDFNAGGIQDQ
jgi:hypothetical protein